MCIYPIQDRCLPLTTPSRKRLCPSPLALELLPSGTPESKGVESPAASTRQSSCSYYTNSDEDTVPGKVEEITSSKHIRKKAKLKEEPLPDPFVLPENYRPDVEVALQSGKMTSETRKAFLSQVAASIFTRKRYPSREEFLRVALDVVRRYPFLESPVPGSLKTVRCV